MDNKVAPFPTGSRWDPEAGPEIGQEECSQPHGQSRLPAFRQLSSNKEQPSKEAPAPKLSKRLKKERQKQIHAHTRTQIRQVCRSPNMLQFSQGGCTHTQECLHTPICTEVEQVCLSINVLRPSGMRTFTCPPLVCPYLRPPAQWVTILGKRVAGMLQV